MTPVRPNFLVKTSPRACAVGDVIQVNERAMYDGRLIRVGDRIVVWFSESKGGTGLAYTGEVQNRHAVSGTSTYVELSILLVCSISGVTIGDLEPYRDVRDGTPLSMLSAKLYRHSHDKVCLISGAEADFLIVGRG